MPRRMNHRTPTEVLRAVIERPHMRATGWCGGPPQYRVRPKLVAEIFGDGKVLFILTPCITSTPNYYVVRIDSSWSLQGSRYCYDGDAPIRDHLDEIYDAIREEYGEVDYEDQGAYHDSDDKESEWPLLDLTIGCRWGVDEWPLYPDKKPKRSLVSK